MKRWRIPAVAGIAVLAILFALLRLIEAGRGVVVDPTLIGTIPATIYRPVPGPKGPVVIIAHGFAGSQQLMQSFAYAAARNGYPAVTFDFAGHGRNPEPLTGNLSDVDGATKRLLDDMKAVSEIARSLGDGRLAVVGHSMASDIAVRFAEQTPDVEATIAVSMFSPAVTATAPRNLLVIVGDWEPMLKREALRAAGLALPGGEATPFVTTGDFAQGTARRVAISPHVEHASVLFSATSLREAVMWLDQSFGITHENGPIIDPRGEWIALLLGASILLGWPLSHLLPRCAEPPAGASLPWRRLWPAVLAPAVLTPLVLYVLPTHFLPVLVGDYIAVHFALYGLIGLVCLAFTPGGAGALRVAPTSWLALALAAAAVVCFGFLALVWPIDSYLTSFVLGPQRLVLFAAMLGGTLVFFMTDEWLTRGTGHGALAYPATKIAFLGSLAAAVSLNPGKLFFLVIIAPVVALFFVIYGLISRWCYRATGHPFVAGIACAVAFAWAIAATFPLIAG